MYVSGRRWVIIMGNITKEHAPDRQKQNMSNTM